LTAHHGIVGRTKDSPKQFILRW